LWQSQGREDWQVTATNRAKRWKSWMADTSSAPQFHFVEVKNVSLARGASAQFPDAVTERGQKHIQELLKLMAQGHTAELLFLIQRTDTESFSPAKDIDKEYSQMLEEAYKKGLKITPAQVELSEQGFVWKRTLPVVF
ncbi:MAG: DNA/RNA nuclease SfsA, partial [Bdellovibrionales bacterium]|nr:DNA/RNA nuclease SfsA [Bdellovibrionales bacterium]